MVVPASAVIVTATGETRPERPFGEITGAVSGSAGLTELIISRTCDSLADCEMVRPSMTMLVAMPELLIICLELESFRALTKEIRMSVIFEVAAGADIWFLTASDSDVELRTAARVIIALAAWFILLEPPAIVSSAASRDVADELSRYITG
ncbi:MAG: hypothetical protein BWY32_03604 [bacterium ADurb.Bin243]|nr:MAG: hypothetical protein BWY32_03604 [bacterium ADurb.Bin243]